MDEVSEAFRRFGLDQASGGGRSPVELLKEAHSALSKPGDSVAGPAAVLVPARESVDSALAALLRRRPTQEPAGTPLEKVSSIGRQAGIQGLPSGHFERLGAEVVELRNRLSGAKQAQMSDVEVRRLFDTVLRYFESLLAGLDLAKLRPL
jgi:hypothetical protein